MGAAIGACLGCAVPVSRGADPMYFGFVWKGDPFRGGGSMD